MKREIKFIGYHKPTGKIIDLHGITPLALSQGMKGDGLYIPFVDDVILMEYTGLKDKIKKDIYEGYKLINPAGEIGVVVFYQAGFYLECQRKSGVPFYIALTPGFVANKTIIGNIHQHPELLTPTPNENRT